jgi:hypothetical protein
MRCRDARSEAHVVQVLLARERVRQPGWLFGEDEMLAQSCRLVLDEQAANIVDRDEDGSLTDVSSDGDQAFNCSVGVMLD